MHLSVPRWFRRAALAATALAVGSATLLTAHPQRAAGAQPPFKIGLLIPTSGNFAAPGEFMKQGLELYLAEHHDMLGGRHVVIDQADTQGNPAIGLTEARRLVEQDHVDVIVGPLSNAVDQAIIPYLTAHKVPAIYPVLSPDDITQRTPAHYVVRTSAASSQTTQPLGDYAYKVLKYRKVATIAFDFSFGWQSIGGMVATFQGDGGKVEKQIWTPLTASDYSPYLSEIPRNVDAVFCSFSGAAAVNFIKQYKAFGLKMPLVCQGNTVDESTLPATGPAAVGIISALHYSAALDTPANKAFVAAYTKAYGHEPSYYAEGTFDAGLILDHAIASLHGNVANTQAFLEALRSVHVSDAPRGPIAFDAYGNPVENVYIRRTEEVHGTLEDVVIKTYPHVSQFWTFNPKTFLAHPVYSRTYPPCNACT
ncbi:MAG TPA: ABC transporter substrate-binding protein [Candidatus Dormibacteraeota bacterium]|nr:ABC transporter substrate-binding protein [Candidatus Dormibacteraeota bacterium]